MTEQSPNIDNSFIGIYITTFSTVFLAELGDKTQIATLLLSAQSSKPLIVFIGASIALIFSSLISVVLGRWLAGKLKPNTFNYIAGTLMIGLGLWIGVQASVSLFNLPRFW